MNLKDAFRFQNKLQALMNEAQSILDDSRNICKSHTTVLCGKVMPGAENETTVDAAPSEYADRIGAVVDFLLHLLAEQEKLAGAIHEAKAALEIDMDSEVSLNGRRQRSAGQRGDHRQRRCGLPLQRRGQSGGLPLRCEEGHHHQL